MTACSRNPNLGLVDSKPEPIFMIPKLQQILQTGYKTELWKETLPLSASLVYGRIRTPKVTKTWYRTSQKRGLKKNLTCQKLNTSQLFRQCTKHLKTYNTLWKLLSKVPTRRSYNVILIIPWTRTFTIYSKTPLRRPKLVPALSYVT